MQVREEKVKKKDLSITMDLDDLRQVLCQLKTPEQLLEEQKIIIDMPKEVLIKFFDCFESGDELVKQK